MNGETNVLYDPIKGHLLRDVEVIAKMPQHIRIRNAISYTLTRLWNETGDTGYDKYEDQPLHPESVKAGLRNTRIIAETVLSIPSGGLSKLISAEIIGTSLYDAYYQTSTQSGSPYIPVAGNITRAIIPPNPFVTIGLGISDMTGGTDSLYNWIGR